MKKVIVIAAIALLNLETVNAQTVAQVETQKPAITTTENPKLLQAIGATLGQMGAVKSPDELVAVANTFSRIADAEPKEWLPRYYAALCKTNAGYWSMKTKGMAAAQELAKSALVDVENALKIAPAESELEVLKAYVYQLQLIENPMANGEKFTPLIFEALGKAEQMNPANPRVNSIRGQFLMNMPEAYGGGAAKAMKDLKIAETKFAAFQPATAVSPNWGGDQNAGALKRIAAKQ